MLSADSIEQLLTYLCAQGCSPHTIRAYKADLNGWLRWLEQSGPLPADLAQADQAAARYLTAHRTSWAPTTTIRRITALRRWAAFHGATNFLAEYRAPRPALEEAHPLEEGIDGVLRMVEAAEDPRLAALVALCGLCGLRVSEAVRVQIDDINLKRGELKVYGKGSKERVIPIPRRARPALKQAERCAMYEGRNELVGYSPDYARKLIVKLGEKVGMRVASHDLRATFATSVHDKCLNLRVVQTLLGHASVETTQRYTGVTRTQLNEAVNL